MPNSRRHSVRSISFRLLWRHASLPRTRIVHTLLEHRLRSLPSPINSQIENIVPLIVAHDIVELFRLDTLIQIQIRVRDAFLALYRVADLSASGIEEEGSSLR